MQQDEPREMLIFLASILHTVCAGSLYTNPQMRIGQYHQAAVLLSRPYAFDG